MAATPVVSFLEELVSDVRLAIDDAAISAKFSDAEVLRFAGMAFRRAFRDVSAVSSRPVVLTHDISITTSQRSYALPPCIGEILLMGEWDSELGHYKWKLDSPSRWSPDRPGVHIAGRRIVWDVAPTTAFTLRVEYSPGADFRPHEGVVTVTTADLTDATLDLNLVDPATESADLKLGSVDDRQNAYVGGVIRMWQVTDEDPPVVQERLITAHTVDPTHATSAMKRVISVEEAWSPALTNAEDYRYEIWPLGYDGFRQAVMLGAAVTLCAMSGMNERRQALLAEYVLAIRTEKLFEAYFSPTGDVWATDTDEAYAGGYHG